MNLAQARQILGIDQSASPEDAKRAYRNLAKTMHPDINKDPDSENKFKQINEAYNVFQKGEEEPPHFNHDGFNPFEQHIVRDARNIDLHATISFKDSVFGCKQDVKFTRNAKCADCNGRGSQKINNGCQECGGQGKVHGRQGPMIFTRTCNKCLGRTESAKCSPCNGAGTVSTDTSIAVTVPGGIQDGNILRLNNMGNFAGSFMTLDQYTNADLHVSVTQEPDLHLDGTSVVSTIDLSLLEAIQGCTKSVKTVLGKQEIKISPLAKNKDEIIIPRLGVDRQGNQRVILNVNYPNDLSTLIEALKEPNV
jgi:molecular chaperone DnaJ